jgi:hypothetical protein
MVIKIIFLLIYFYSILLVFLLFCFTKTADYYVAIDP